MQEMKSDTLEKVSFRSKQITLSFSSQFLIFPLSNNSNESHLTSAVCVALRLHEHMLQEEGQQRPLQPGAGSVEQRAEGGGLPHLQLVGVGRQDVTHAQESLHVRVRVCVKRGEGMERKEHFK